MTNLNKKINDLQIENLIIQQSSAAKDRKIEKAEEQKE